MSFRSRWTAAVAVVVVSVLSSSALPALGAEPTVTVAVVLKTGQRDYVVKRFPTAASTAAAKIAELAALPGAVSADIDHPVAAFDDPGTSQQWHIVRPSVLETRATTTGAGVTVAVVDSGVNPAAVGSDLTGKVLTGKDFVAPGGDGTADGLGHGSHVAAIIAATADNSIAGQGVAPGVAILPVRVLDNAGSGSTANVAAGIRWAADNGAKVINLSLGGTSTDTAMSSAVTYAVGLGVVVIGAAGNAGNTAVSYPAGYSNAISVAATTKTLTRATFSQYNSTIDLAAPGVGICSSYADSLYCGDGTSYAAPQVSAVAALLRAAAPSATVAQITAALQNTATDLGTAGRDNSFGYGLVQPASALAAITATAPARTALALSVPATSPAPGTSQTVTATLTASGAAVSGATVELWAGRASSQVRFPALLATATTDASGAATFTVAPSLSTDFFARFTGTATKASAYSAESAMAVTGAPYDGPAITLTATGSSAYYAVGESVSLVATLIGDYPRAPLTGATVKFYGQPSGGTQVQIGTVTTDASGVARFTGTITASKGYTFKASATWDGLTTSSSVSPSTFEQRPTLLFNAPATVTTGSNAALVATFLDAAGAPVNGAKVNFQYRAVGATGWGVITTVTTGADGTATLDWPVSTATEFRADYSYSNAIATYTYTPTTTSALTVTPVAATQTAASSTLALTAASSSVFADQTTTLTATLASAASVAAKTVTLSASTNGSTWTTVATGSTTVNGTATFTVVPGRAYRVAFAGDAGLAAATSDAVTVTTRAPVDSTLSLSAAASEVFADETTTLTATLTSTAATSNKTVTLSYSSDDTTWTAIGSGTTATDGTVVFTAIPGRSYRAAFSGDAGLAAATSASVTVTTRAPVESTVTLTAADASVFADQTTTLTATLTATEPVAGLVVAVASSTDGSTWTTLGSAAVGANGATTFTVSPGFSYRASFAGDLHVAAATSAPTMVAVRTAVNTTVTLTAGADTARNGDQVTFTVALSATGVSVAGRTVVVEHGNGTTWTTAATVTTGVDGTATATVTVGNDRSFRARFAGTVQLGAATSATVTVDQPAPSPSTVTATVTSPVGGVYTAARISATVTSDGTVAGRTATLERNGDVLATATTSVSGTVTFDVSSASPVTYRVRVAATADAYEALSAEVTFTPQFPSLTLTGPATAPIGTTPTLTATLVLPGQSAAAKTVTLSYQTATGWSTLASKATGTDGVATFAITTVAGARTYRVVYSTVATSDTLTVTGYQATTALEFTAPATVQGGVTFTATATLTTTDGPVANRTVALQRLSGTTWSTLTSLRTDTTGSVTFTTSLTATAQLRASFAGDTGYAATFSAPVSVTTTKMDTTLTASASTDTLQVDSSFTVTGTLTATTGLAGRKVSLQYQSSATAWSTLATLTTAADGSVTYTTAPTATRTYRLSFAGDAGYAASLSTPFTVTVTKYASSMTLAAPASAFTGATVTLTATLTGPGAPLGSRTVGLQRYVASTGTWAAVTSKLTDTTGTAVFTVTTPTSGSDVAYRVVFTGDTRFDRSDATATITLSRRSVTGTVTTASKTSLSATFSSNDGVFGTRTVTLQRFNAATSTWSTVASKSTTSGAVTFTMTASTAAVTYRVSFAGDTLYSPAVTDSVTV